MIRALRYLFLAALAVVMIALALSNRAPVELRALPPEAGAFLGVDWAVQVPLFLVILGGVLLGLLIGFVWEWMREHRLRAEAAQTRREAERLSREVKKLRQDTQGPQDDVLALLDHSARKA